MAPVEAEEKEEEEAEGSIIISCEEGCCTPPLPPPTLGKLLLVLLLPLLPFPLALLFWRTADEVDELLVLLPLLLLPLELLLLVDCCRDGRRLEHQMRTVVSSEADASMFG